MDSFAEKPARHVSAVGSAAADNASIGRVAVLGVVFAGAMALGSASIAAGYPAGGPSLFAALAAVTGGAVWWFEPRVGYWILLIDGLLTMVVAGMALARGAVPSVLVAFWGGSALLLAAILHLTSGADRSGAVTLVAVISLLVLSALGLGQYVRATWTQDERAILEDLSRLTVPSARAVRWTASIVPAPSGAWRCTWVVPAAPTDALRSVRDTLVREGWRVEGFSSGGLAAAKADRALVITLGEAAEYPDVSSEDAAADGVQLVATVRRMESDSTP